MRTRLICIVAALPLAACSPQRIGTAIGQGIAAPFMAAVTAPEDAPAFQPVSNVPPEHAVLYVYRIARGTGDGGLPKVTVAGAGKFWLKRNGYRSFILKPGTYDITVECSGNWRAPTITRPLSLAAGEEHYVHITFGWGQSSASADGILDAKPKPPPSIWTWWKCDLGSTVMTLVGREPALADLQRTRLLDE